MRSLLVLLLLAVVPGAFGATRTVVGAKSEIGFSVKQMGVAVTGRFTRFAAHVELDPDQLEASSAEITVDTGSLTTGDADADSTARDKPWLDVVDFPKAVFKTKGLRSVAGGRYEARGTLTLRGKSRELTFPFTLADQKDGGAVLAGNFTLNRSDFGVGGGEWNASDVVANDVAVQFRLTLAPP